MNSAAARADGRIRDITARALAWINMGRKTGRTLGGEIRDLDMVMDSFRHIARERSESAYSWYSEGDGKREIAGVGDKVE